jgi:hypothetical protein
MESIQDLSLRQRLGNVYHAGRDDAHDASLGEKSLALATTGGLAFEWGTGNEALLSAVGANVHELTHNPVITGVTTGGVSFVEQGALGLLMAATVNSYPRFATAVREMTGARESGPGRLPIVKRFGRAMLLGSAAELAVENSAREHSYAENRTRAVRSAGMISVGSTAIFGIASAGLQVAAEHGMESQAETAVHVAQNPLTYALAFGSVFAFNKTKRMINNSRKDSGATTAQEKAGQ